MIYLQSNTLFIPQVMVWKANLKSVEPCENLDVVEEEEGRACSPLNVTAQVPLTGQGETEEEEEDVVVVEECGGREEEEHQERPKVDAHYDQMQRNEVLGFIS